MPIEIDGIQYFSATDINREIGITRQTLWRWRRQRDIPQGQKYRGHQLLFTKQDVEAIRQHANRLEPVVRRGISSTTRSAARLRKKHDNA
jgi:hypothetical protein